MSETITTTFPRLEARNLEGRNFSLPGDFEGERNLAIVAFKQWHQRLVDSWVPHLKGLQAQHADLRVYELPTIAWPYLFMRWVIDGGMTAGIPDKAVREVTLTVYTDLNNVTRPLNITNTDTIHLFLVDKTGRITWRGQGGFDEGQLAGLAEVLSKV
ncbi:MAG: hypothetical protein MUD01_18075 [Chloroflexaceae bacterium]|jgi:hypothetical protein|nr:hypothetical protein [Chloroflexaceae bacterium]